MPRSTQKLTPGTTGFALTLGLSLAFAILASSMWPTRAPGTAVATGADASLTAMPAGVASDTVR